MTMEWSVHKMNTEERERTTRLVVAVANLIVAIGRDINDWPIVGGGLSHVERAAPGLVAVIDECVISE